MNEPVTVTAADTTVSLVSEITGRTVVRVNFGEPARRDVHDDAGNVKARLTPLVVVCGAPIEEVHNGFTILELDMAFELVKEPGNWKYPIAALVPAKFADACVAAIDFYAGGGAVVSQQMNGQVRITAPGYYEMIGA